MSALLSHRGPDGLGSHIDERRGVFLGHRRLAVLDIEGGQQPMWNEDGSVCVVFNGEIYNHLELRRELLGKGHVFKSDHSDTEVLVHGYEEWGADLPCRLNGMFAFVVYDQRESRLFLARDRFGEKPLYYTHAGGLFAFASELRALLAHFHVRSSFDRLALKKYFAYSFIPAPHSLYERIRKLPAGCSLTYDAASDHAELRQYWRFRIEPDPTIDDSSTGRLIEELRDLLSQAVRRRLVSDVPLGVFLSGGIDSTAVLAFASGAAGANRTNTFSIGFAEPSFDESRFARLAAQAFGSNHHESILGLEDARALSAEVLGRLDEPMVDSSILPTFLLCRFARERVTVALGGDGGDELFAGYDPFKALAIAAAYQRLVPTKVHVGLRKLLRLLPTSTANMSLDFKLNRALRGVSYAPEAWNPAWLGALDSTEIEELFDEPVSIEELFEEALTAWRTTSADNIVDKTLEFYTRFYLQDDILTKVDRASMLVSLEARAPFLDNDLVEFARKLPYQLKYRRGQTKWILKRALRGIVPDAIIDRKKKGFGIPLASWMKEWQAPEESQALPGTATQWARERWREHSSGAADHRHFLWAWHALGYHPPSVVPTR
jgi:asparagine synthase (glutamine-hydrolysing)